MSFYDTADEQKYDRQPIEASAFHFFNLPLRNRSKNKRQASISGIQLLLFENHRALFAFCPAARPIFGRTQKTMRASWDLWEEQAI